MGFPLDASTQAWVVSSKNEHSRPNERGPVRKRGFVGRDTVAPGELRMGFMSGFFSEPSRHRICAIAQSYSFPSDAKEGDVGPSPF